MHSPDWLLVALGMVHSVPSPDWVLEALVALLLVSVSLSVLDLGSLVAFPLVDISLSVSGENKA